MPDTKKFETFSLNPTEEQALAALAESSPFWASIQAKYAEYDGLTRKQKEAFDRERARDGWKKTAAKINGTPVRNKVLRDGKPVCFLRECSALATVVVSNVGVCADHEDDQREADEEYRRQREAERAK